MMQDHFVIKVDGEEFIRMNGDVWEGKRAFNECNTFEARKDIGWKTLELFVYRQKLRGYICQCSAQIGSGF